MIVDMNAGPDQAYPWAVVFGKVAYAAHGRAREAAVCRIAGGLSRRSVLLDFGHAQAMWIPGEPSLMLPDYGVIAYLARRSGLRSITAARAWAEAGGLMSYGPNFPANYARAAYYVDRILRGSIKPCEPSGERVGGVRVCRQMGRQPGPWCHVPTRCRGTGHGADPVMRSAGLQDGLPSLSGLVTAHDRGSAAP